MAMARNEIVGVAVAVLVLYGVLQVAALPELTGKRQLTGRKYLLVTVTTVMFLLHLLWGSMGPAAIEFYIVVAMTPIAIVHLAVLLIQERREKAMLLKADG